MVVLESRAGARGEKLAASERENARLGEGLRKVEADLKARSVRGEELAESLRERAARLKALADRCRVSDV